jgi:hypothetical protein
VVPILVALVRFVHREYEQERRDLAVGPDATGPQPEMPFVRYLETTVAEHPDEVTVVLLPEYRPRHWWDRILDNDNANRIREALVGRRDIIVLDAPYRREDPEPGSE